MQSEFEVLVDRDGIGNMKGGMLENAPQGALLLAGAEMDYPTAPVIREALSRFAERGIYGFTLSDSQYCKTVCRWMKDVRGVCCEADEVVPTLGTIFGICTAIRAFTEPGDGVIIQHPSYYRYDVAVEKTGRRVVSNPLIEENGMYRLDFSDLEEKMRDRRNKLMILCNPHNPTGRVFPESDLKQLAALANAYDTTIFSDEIFAEVTFDGHTAVPYIAVDPAHGITSTSLGKVFNLTGVNHANLLIKNPALRERYAKQRCADHFGSIDPFFYAALVAGYSKEGLEWIQAMNEHVRGNYTWLKAALADRLPSLRLSPLEGSYVTWMDFRAWGLPEARLQDLLVQKAGILGDPGSDYGPGGAGLYRFNLATPHRNMETLAERLETAYRAAAH